MSFESRIMNSTISRLEKAFLRKNIQLSRTNNIIRMTRQLDQTSADILLPADFPLEEKAVTQLLNFASVHSPDAHGHVCKACATPDFHPGSIAPVGSIVATTSDFVIPAAIGTDINCGMRLLTTGLSLNQVEDKKSLLESQLTRVLLQNERNVPMSALSFALLFNEGALSCIESLCHEGIWDKVDRERLSREVSASIGLSEFTGTTQYAPEALLQEKRALFRDPNLGTTGSGNHFVELQVVDSILDRHLAWQYGLKSGDVVVMIHSGSRDVGFYVGNRWMDKAKKAWPKDLKHPSSGLYGLSGELAEEYLKAMGVAARYAWLNRVVLAELVRGSLQSVFDDDQSALIVDVPHNVVLQEQGMNIHRKGATPARAGDLALIPGSMGDYSYLASGLGNPDWLWSCSHGAGRSVRRQKIRALKMSQHETNNALPWHCVTLSEERKIEESPHAYKKIGPVIDVQEEAGLIHSIARFRPWMTFKA